MQVTQWEIEEDKAGVLRGPKRLSPIRVIQLDAIAQLSRRVVGGIVQMSANELWTAFGNQIFSLNVSSLTSSLVNRNGGGGDGSSSGGENRSGEKNGEVVTEMSETMKQWLSHGGGDKGVGSDIRSLLVIEQQVHERIGECESGWIGKGSVGSEKCVWIGQGSEVRVWSVDRQAPIGTIRMDRSDATITCLQYVGYDEVCVWC